MAKFYGEVGYVETIETPAGSGVHVEEATEFPYYGDVLQDTRKSQPADKLNDDISVQNRISILADAYAFEHYFAIKYVVWMGVAWSVSSVEVKSPRLILSLGSVYNGPTP